MVPERRYQDGDRVRVTVAPCRDTGTVVSARLIGKRPPGWVYTVVCDSDGHSVFMPGGFLAKAV